MSFNLGSITFGLAANTAGLTAATQQLEAFGRVTSSVMAQAQKGVETNITQLQRQEGAAVRAIQNVQNASAAINRMKIAPEIRTEGIQQLERAVADFVRMMSSTKASSPLDTLAFQRASLGLKEATDQVTRSLREQESAAKSAGDAGAQAMQRQERAIIQAEFQTERLIDAINRAHAAGEVSGGQASRLTNAANLGLTNGVTALSGATALDSEGFQRAQNQIRGALSNVNRDLQATRAHASMASEGFRALSSAAMLSLGPLSGISFRLHALNTMIQDHGILLGGAAAAMVGFATAMGTAVVQMVHVTILFQQAQTTLQAVTNSAAIGNYELQVLRQTADQAGQSFLQLAPAFSRFVTSANSTGQGLHTTNEEFRQMAMIAGTLHLTTEESQRMLLAFDQMFSAGRAQGQELRQLFNVMPGTFHIASEAARQMGFNLRDALRHGSLEANEFIRRYLDIGVQMLHIDMTQPLHTLQAELGRVQSRFDDLKLALVNTLQSTPAFIGALQTLGGLLQSMATNINQVLAVVAAFGGALAGLAVGGALASVIQGIGGLILLVPRFNAAMGLGIGIINSMRAAFTGLAIAEGFTAGPIVGLISGIVTLTAVVGGSVIAYNAMNNVLAQNAAAMNDATQGPVEQYINSQHRMLQATQDTTEAMIRQQAVLTETSRQAMQGANDTLAAAVAASARNQVDMAYATNQYSDQLDPGSGGVVGGRTAMAAAQGARIARDAQQAWVAVSNAQNTYVRQQANLVELNRILMQQVGMPEPEGHGSPGSTAHGRRPPDPERGLRSLNAMVQQATLAQTLMDHLFEGPVSDGLIQSIQEAHDRLFNMEADQRAALTGILTAAGFDVQALGGLGNAIAVIQAQTRLANEEIRRFNTLWNNVDEGREQLRAMNTQLDYLRGGASPYTMWWVEGLNQAREAIRALNGGGTDSLEGIQRALNAMQQTGDINSAGSQAILNAFAGNREQGLTQLIALMESLNVQFDHTGTSAQQAESALTTWYQNLGQTQAQVQAATRTITALNDSMIQLAESREQLALSNRGGSQEQFVQLDAYQNAVHMFQDMRRANDTRSLEAVNNMLANAGFNVGTLEQRYAAFTVTLDRNREAIDAHREALRQNQQAWVDWGTQSLHSLEAWATGTGKFMDVVRSTLRQLAMTILHTTLFAPIENQWAAMMRNIGRGSTTSNPADANPMSGIFGIGGGLIPGFKGIPGTGGNSGPAGSNFGLPQGFNLFRPSTWSGGSRDGHGAAQGLDAATDAVKMSFDKLQGAGKVASEMLGKNLVQATAGSIGKMLIEGAVKTNETTTALGATGALTALTTSAAAAAAGLSAVAVASGASSVGGAMGAAGGILGGVGSLFGSIMGGAGSVGSSMLSAASMLGGFAVGGQMTAGVGGRVGEIGSGVEIFVPGQSGRMLSANDLGGLGGGGSTHIDARSTFIIQGNADSDTFAQMQAWAYQREMRLRADLPVLIDSRVLDSSIRNRY